MIISPIAHCSQLVLLSEDEWPTGQAVHVLQPLPLYEFSGLDY